MPRLSSVPLTFDVIGEAASLYIVEERREGISDRRDSGIDDLKAFQANLDRTLASFNQLRRETSADNVSAFFQSMEHQLAAKSTDVSSVESNLDRLLAARDDLAVDILEALQMVRPSASHSLSR
jgi:hypothetical protein